MIIKLDRGKDKVKVMGKARGVLRNGGVVVMPTETAYGFMADATNGKAVRKIYKIKGRSFKKFLPLIVGSLEQMREFFKLDRKETELAKRYKGLTIILKPLKHKSIKTLKQKKIYLVSEQKTCAVRISKYKLARELALGLGRPITATSANRSGGENCYNLGCVLKSFQPSLGGYKNFYASLKGGLKTNASPKGGLKLVDMILDGGKLKKRKPSTIVQVEGGKIEILRQGEIKIQKAKVKR